MKMTTFVTTLLFCLLSSFFDGSARGAMVTFTFINMSGNVGPFDSSGPGFDTVDGLTLSTVDVQAPEYVEDGSNWTWDGTSYATAATSVTSGDQLVINNLSIGNSAGITSENTNINEGESWTFKFDASVVFTQIDIASWDSGHQATLEVDGETPVVFTGTDSEPFNNPLGALVIPANTNITFTNSAAVPTPINGDSPEPYNNWRIDSLTVEVVIPEPSAMVLLLMSVLTAPFVRHKR